MTKPERQQRLNERNALSADQLRQVAEDDARRLLGVSAAEAYKMIDEEDPRVAGTIAEIELKNIRWLLERSERRS